MDLVLWRHAERQLRAPPSASGTLPLRARHGGQALGMPLLRLEALTLQFVWARLRSLLLYNLDPTALVVMRRLCHWTQIGGFYARARLLQLVTLYSMWKT